MTPSWNLRQMWETGGGGGVPAPCMVNHTHGGDNVTGDDDGVVLNSDPVATNRQSRALCAVFYLLSSASVSSLAKG